MHFLTFVVYGFRFLSYPRHAICQKQSQPIISWSKCNWIGHIRYTYVRSLVRSFMYMTVLFFYFIHIQKYSPLLKSTGFFRVLHVRYVRLRPRTKVTFDFYDISSRVMYCVGLQCRHFSQVIFISFNAISHVWKYQKKFCRMILRFFASRKNLTLIGAYCRNISETKLLLNNDTRLKLSFWMYFNHKKIG